MSTKNAVIRMLLVILSLFAVNVGGQCTLDTCDDDSRLDRSSSTADIVDRLATLTGQVDQLTSEVRRLNIELQDIKISSGTSQTTLSSVTSSAGVAVPSTTTQPTVYTSTCLVQLKSWGCVDTDKTGFVRVNGSVYLNDTARAIRTALIDPASCTASDRRTFDISLSQSDTQSFVSYVSRIANTTGAILAAITNDNIRGANSQPAFAALASIGLNIDTYYDCDKAVVMTIMGSTGAQRQQPIIELKGLNSGPLTVPILVRVSSTGVVTLTELGL